MFDDDLSPTLRDQLDRLPQLTAVAPRAGQDIAQQLPAAAQGGDGWHDTCFAGAAMARVIDAVPHLVWTSDANGVVTSANDRWREFAVAHPLGSVWTDMLHPEEQSAAAKSWQDRSERGETYEAEHRLPGRDGNDRWVMARIVPTTSEDDHPSVWCGSLTDIHALKSSQIRQEFMVHELSHRLQNVFAVVESLLSLSARTQPQAADFAAAAAARIRSLALANDVIRAQHDPKAKTTLHGLLAALLAPYQPANARCAVVEIVGPDHPLGASSASLLALVIHELTVNAAKFGALSQDGGRVTITTRLDAGQLHLEWTENGGPQVIEPPTGRGFGTLLTERGLRQPLAAQVERIWCPTGLTVKLSVPCERLANQGFSEPGRGAPD